MIKITVNEQDYFVEVIHKKKNKITTIKIHDGRIIITSPIEISIDEIENIVKRKEKFIKKHLKSSDIKENQIHLLGKKYLLCVVNTLPVGIKILEDKIEIFALNNQTIKSLINELYKKTLINIVEKYTKEILIQFHLPLSIEFSYKDVKGYFGQCMMKRQKIVLALMLAKYDIKYILSVIYHECAHFKYPNHQKEFYSYLEQYYPNYKEIQKELRRIKYNEKY